MVDDYCTKILKYSELAVLIFESKRTSPAAVLAWKKKTFHQKNVKIIIFWVCNSNGGVSYPTSW